MKRYIRVTSTGQKIKKIKCPAGQKAKDGRCVTYKAAERISRKKGAKYAVRTKNAHSGIMKRAVKKMLKAKKKRKNHGVWT